MKKVHLNSAFLSSRRKLMHFQAVWVPFYPDGFSRSFGKSLKQEVFYSFRQQAGEPWCDCVLGSGAHPMNLSRAALFELIAAPGNRHSCPNLQLENQLQDPRKNSESCRRVKCALRNLRPAHFQKTGVARLLQCTQKSLAVSPFFKNGNREVYFLLPKTARNPKCERRGSGLPATTNLI